MTHTKILAIAAIAWLSSSFLFGQEATPAPKISDTTQKLRTREEIIQLRAKQLEEQEKIKNLEKKLKGQENRFEQKARKELEKQEKLQAKLERESQEAFSRAGVVGCSNVWVSPAVERRSFGFVNTQITVTNPNSTPLTIKDDATGEIVVRGLCPSATMTLRKMFPITADSTTVPVSFTAMGNVSGRPGISHLQSSMSSYQAGYNTTQVVIWDAKLQIQ